MVEEGDAGWDGGLVASCSVMGRDHGREPLERRRYAGMMRLLGKVFEGAKNAGKKIQGNAKQDGSVEVRPRLSDGKKADYPRKALVV